MNINELIEVLNSNDSEVRIYFTRKRGIKYISYSPQVGLTLQRKIKKFMAQYLDEFKDVEQVNFSPVGYREGTIEVCDTSYINSYDDVLQSFSDENISREPISDDIINKLNFYCLVISLNNRRIMFIRRVTKFKKLSSSGIFGRIKGNEFDEIDSTLLGIDGNIDIVINNDEVLILNHISLERVFSLSNQYLEKAQVAISLIRESNRIDNFDQFEEDCLNDRRITRTLTKMLTEENRLENCFSNFENVINVIDIFELDIDIDKSGEVDKIIYNDKEQLMDIIRLVRDSYYRSIINDRTGIDDSL